MSSDLFIIKLNKYLYESFYKSLIILLMEQFQNEHDMKMYEYLCNQGMYDVIHRYHDGIRINKIG